LFVDGGRVIATADYSVIRAAWIPWVLRWSARATLPQRREIAAYYHRIADAINDDVPSAEWMRGAADFLAMPNRAERIARLVVHRKHTKRRRNEEN
jgi:hypothetical protein